MEIPRGRAANGRANVRTNCSPAAGPVPVVSVTWWATSVPETATVAPVPAPPVTAAAGAPPLGGAAAGREAATGAPVPAPPGTAAAGTLPLGMMWWEEKLVICTRLPERPKPTVSPVPVAVAALVRIAAVADVPRSVQTEVTSVTVPPAVGQVGWVAPVVPAVVHWYRCELPVVGRATCPAREIGRAHV